MAQQKLFSVDDLFELRFLSDPRISPDGESVVYVERRIDARRDAYVSHLWLVPFEDGKPRRLTRGRVRDSSPRWSPDGGTILFVRERDRRHELVALYRADGKKSGRRASKGGPRARSKSRWKEAVLLDTRGVPSSPCWAPDGKRIAFLYRPLTPEELEARRKRSGRRIQPRVIRRLLHKEDGRGFLPEERNHVWVMDRRGKGLRQLTDGEAEDHGPTWSSDGRSLVFMSNRIPRADYFFGNIDLWSVPARGGDPVKLTLEEGPFVSPSFSPDSGTIAFFGNLDPFASISRNLRPRVVPAAGGPSRELAPEFDRTCTNAMIHDLAEFGHAPQPPAWSPDGAEITFIVSDRGACDVYRCPAGGGKPEALLPGRQDIAAYSTSADGSRWALLAGDAVRPHEVFAWEREAGAEPRPLTRANRKLLARRRVAVPEEVEISVPVEGGTSHALHGWALRPPDFVEGRKYPLVLAIHGGPMAMYGWAYVHEFQVLAAAGFVVLYTNPHGSQGYGESYCMAIRGDWGNLDHRDLMAAADWAERQPFVDRHRMGVTGGSYGGFMTNWIIGHTGRFRAALTDRSISNLHSMHGTSDFGWDFGWEMGAAPWEDPARYLRRSPLTYVDAIRTPLLILHSEMDLRCPVEQADQLFSALTVLGREVEYVRYPEQSHGLSRIGTPSLRKDRLERVLAWFGKHLQGTPGSPEGETGREEGRRAEKAAETADAAKAARPVHPRREPPEPATSPGGPPPIEEPEILPGR
jgi:dipeptidyl aminopeptidase/acylaminoacyl peptidase